MPYCAPNGYLLWVFIILVLVAGVGIGLLLALTRDELHRRAVRRIFDTEEER